MLGASNFDKRDQNEEIDTRPNKVWLGEAAVFTRKNCMPKYGPVMPKYGSRGTASNLDNKDQNEEVHRPTGGGEGDVEVAVHDGMDAVVHDHAPADGGREFHIGVQTKPQGCNMMGPCKTCIWIS